MKVDVILSKKGDHYLAQVSHLPGIRVRLKAGWQAGAGGRAPSGRGNRRPTARGQNARRTARLRRRERR